jgi:hypothetical protein
MESGKYKLELGGEEDNVILFQSHQRWLFCFYDRWTTRMILSGNSGESLLYGKCSWNLDPVNTWMVWTVKSAASLAMKWGRGANLEPCCITVTRVFLLGTCGMEMTEMTARTEKYAGEGVVDVSVLGVGTSLARKV